MASIALIRYVGGLVFDATFQEKHRAKLEITEEPVETGVTITDHSYMKPLTLSLQVGVTNTPLRNLPNDIFAAQNATRIQAAFDLLSQLQAAGEPFDIQTGLKLYTNMLCASIDVTQEATSANALAFDCEFQQVTFVSTQTVAFSAPRTLKHSASKVKKGEKQAKETTDPAKQGSILNDVWKYFGKGATPTSVVQSIGSKVSGIFQ